MKKLLRCFLVGLLMTAMLLTGCGASASETASDTLTTGQVAVDGIQYGQILSVTDSEIVLALGTLDQKVPSGNEKDSTQTRPEKPTDGAVQAPSGDNAPGGGAAGDNAPPEGSAPPEGNESAGGGTPPTDANVSGAAVNGTKGKSMMELTGDKLTISITEDTIITYMRMNDDTSDTSASLSDLAVGDAIAVTVAEDGKTAFEITIMTFGTLGEVPDSTVAETEE